MLEKEFNYYLAHQDELVKKYKGKHLVIIGEQVVGVYDNEQDAYFSSLKKFEAGTFLIQHCESGPESYSQTYHSRVAFA